jgi:hypothetical protein
MNRYRIREASYLPSSRPQITAICDVITSIPPMVSRESPGKMGRREIITHYETNPRPSPWTNDPATTHRARSQCEGTGDAGRSQFIHNNTIGTWRHQGASAGQAGPTGGGSRSDAGRCCRDGRLPRRRRPTELRAVPHCQISRIVRSSHDGTDPSLQGVAGDQPGRRRLEGQRGLTWLRRLPKGLGTARAPKRAGCLLVATNNRSGP